MPRTNRASGRLVVTSMLTMALAMQGLGPAMTVALAEERGAEEEIVADKTADATDMDDADAEASAEQSAGDNVDAIGDTDTTTDADSRCDSVVLAADAEDDASETILYTDACGTTCKVDARDVTDIANASGDSVKLSDGTYYVSKSKTFNGRLEVKGEVLLILGPRVKLECKKGIHVSKGNTLTICDLNEGYAESKGVVADASGKNNAAGIGGNDDQSGGTINLCVDCEAKGGADAAGIGGGEDGHGGTINIYRGVIDARGNEGGAGIGGGENGDSGNINIYGGNVTAVGGSYLSWLYTKTGGAGIGGGEDGTNNPISILGGEVTATAGYNAAGIGGGDNGELRGKVTIKNCTVHVDTAIFDSACGACIGGGYGEDQKGKVTIENATVYARNQGEGAGIGGGAGDAGCDGGDGGEVEISNSYVEAFTCCDGAGIGGGGGAAGAFDGGNGGKVIIKNGSTVIAESQGLWDSGTGSAIGKGKGGDKVGSVAIYDGAWVKATADGDKRAPVAERESYCAKRSRVRIEPCGHELSYDITPAGHVRHCRCCKSMETEMEHHCFGEDNSHDCCDECGFEKPSFASTTYATDGSLSLIFWLKLPEGFEAKDFAGSYVDFNVGGAKPRTERVALTADMPRNDEGQYGIACGVSVAELSDDVTAVFHYYGECEACDDSVSSSLEVSEYDAHSAGKLESLIYDPIHMGNESVEKLNYLRSMVNYAHYLQPYLASTRKWKLGVDHARTDLSYEGVQDAVRSEAKSELTSQPSLAYGDRSHVKVHCKAVLGSTAELSFRITPEKDADISVSAYLGDKQCACERKDDGSVVVHATGIRATDFDKRVRVEIKGEGRYGVIEESPLTYLGGLYQQDQSKQTEDAVVAAYSFYKHAGAFVRL